MQGPVLPLLAIATRGPALLRPLRRYLVTGVTGGLLSLVAYGLVLWAQTRGALSAIAALRETSIVMGAVIGAVLFREPLGRTRIIAAALITTGVVMTNM